MKEFTLEGEQTIYQVTETYGQIKAAMAAGSGLSIHLQHIHDCDTSLVQLLLWARLESDRHQRELHLLQPPANLVEIVNILGLASVLKLNTH